VWLLAPLGLLTTLLPDPDPTLAPAMRLLPVLISTEAAAAQRDSGATLNDAMLVLWIVGALLLAAIAWRAQRRYRRALGRLSRRADGCLLAESESVGPSVLGLWRPRIVLPADFERRYDDEERELILAHERVHLARGDLWINLAALALRCLQWFNPIAQFAQSRLRFDQELAADAAVLAHRPERTRRYAEAMLKTQLNYELSPLGCHWQSAHPLKERIMMLKTPLPGLRRTVLGLVLVSTLGAGFGLAAWAAQPIPQALDDPEHPATYNAIRPPRYPTSAIEAKASGDVVLRVLVDREGLPEQVEVESSTGNADLDLAAVTAVRKWKFNPASNGNTPTPTWVLVPINFSLDGDPQPDVPAETPSSALDTIQIRGG
jgi:bla regulator protein BlaR1